MSGKYTPYLARIHKAGTTGSQTPMLANLIVLVISIRTILRCSGQIQGRRVGPMGGVRKRTNDGRSQHCITRNAARLLKPVRNRDWALTDQVATFHCSMGVSSEKRNVALLFQ